MEVEIREYRESDLAAIKEIWNEVVEEGIAFPQEQPLDEQSAKEFFASQSFCAVAENDEKVVGLYILHPNNVGRCGHIANASYAVFSSCRGLHAGEKLVRHSIKKAAEIGFSILQFNAVVAERIGFKGLGVIRGGFRMKDGHFEDICPYYIECK